MNKKRIYVFFFMMVAALILTIFFVQPSKAFLFQNAKGDCAGRSRFMYNALYKDDRSAGVVFFGSSRTMNDVNDSLMNGEGERRYLNMGYCRFGRNMDYFFVEEYCSSHQPGIVVLEVREEEGSGTHPLTAFLFPVSKIAEDALSLRTEVFPNLYNKWLCNLKYTRGALFGSLPSAPDPLNTDHGFWYGNKDTDTEALIRKRAKDSVDYYNHADNGGSFNLNSEYYFDKLKTLCKSKNIELRFLYLPEYGNIRGFPQQAAAYERYGSLMLPPDSISKDVLNFSDFGHLNKRGADALSMWLMRQF